jgi:hypothetical protein
LLLPAAVLAVMTVWTILEDVEFAHRLPVLAAEVELMAEPIADLGALESELHDLVGPDAGTWFRHLQAGFDEFRRRRAAEGRPVGGVRLFVTRLWSGSTADAGRRLRYAGTAALRDLFARQESMVILAP